MAASDVLRMLKECSVKMQNMIDCYDHKIEEYFAELENYVPQVKEQLDLNDAVLKNAKAAANSVLRRKSTVHKQKGSKSTSRKSSVTGERRSLKAQKCLLETDPVPKLATVFEKLEVELQGKASRTNNIPEKTSSPAKCDFSKTICLEASNTSTPLQTSSQTPGAIKLPVLTKASKHRKSSYLTQTTPTSGKAPHSAISAQNGTKLKNHGGNAKKAFTKANTDELEKKGAVMPVKKAGPQLGKEGKTTKNQEKQLSSKTDLQADYFSAVAKAKLMTQAKLQADSQPSNAKGIPPRAPLNTTVTITEEEEYTDYIISDFRDSDEEDDDDECNPTKPVPKWAMGLRFKETLLKQSRDMPNVIEIFGKISISPTEMFGVKGKKMVTRNSSAIWTTPDQSFLQF